MRAYADTSFLCALYRLQDNSFQAAAYVQGMREPLNLTSLSLFEFRQSIRLQIFLNEKDHRKGFNRASGLAAQAKLQSNLASGGVLLVAVDWSDVHSVAERLSAQHTLSGGHRSFDILHVATALHLGAGEFLTFDVNQRKLAQAEGLRVPL